MMKKVPATKKSRAKQIADIYLTVHQLASILEETFEDEAITNCVNRAKDELSIALSWVTQRDASLSDTQPTR